jgi:predicted nuclease of predicted toxin-antitoxin system
MKFLCDVHISYAIAKRLHSLGFETIHVNEILDKWFTKDSDISAYADLHDLILISKDADFKNSFVIKKSPNKFIKINLGNISNQELAEILSNNIEFLRKLNLAKRFMVEIDRASIIYVRED